MQRPPRPADEHTRVAAVRRLQMMDESLEPALRDLPRLAAELLQCPIAFCSLIDTDRQWIQARHGCELSEIRRDRSLCGHVILEDRPMVIEDAQRDPGFIDHPMVIDAPNLRAYLGIPLRVGANLDRVGCLCVADRQARTFGPEQQLALRTLGNTVERLLEARLVQLELVQQKAVTNGLLDIHSRHIDCPDGNEPFQTALEHILRLTGCRAGLLLERLTQHSLRECAAQGMEWDANRARLSSIDPRLGFSLEAVNERLSGAHGATLESVDGGNDSDPRRNHGLWCLPIRYLHQKVGYLLLLDRRSSRRAETLSSLPPLLATVGQLLHLRQQSVEHASDRRRLLLMSRVASETTNGVVVTDAAGKIEWINESFERISGYRLDEVRGRKPGDFLQGAGSTEHAKRHMSESLRSRQHFEVEIVNYHRHGEAYWVHISCSPLYDGSGQLEGFIAIETDITERKKSALALERSEARFRSLSQFAPVGIFETDINGRCRYVNAFWCELAGMSPTEADGNGWLGAVHPEDRDKVAAEWHRSTTAGAPFRLDYRFLRPDRSERWLSGQAIGLRDQGGDLIGYIGTVTDITARRESELRMQHAFELLERSSEAAKIGSWEVDLIHRVAIWSRVTRQIHEVDEDYVCEIDTALDFYTPGWSRELIGNCFTKLITDGTPYDVELTLRTAKGNCKWARAIGLAEFRGGTCVRAYGLFQDIDEMKRLERMKQEFVSTVSHELRTPLTAISGALSLLSNGVLDASGTAGRQALEMANRNSIRLNQLVNDLLDLDKLLEDKMPMNLQVEHIAPVIEQAVEALNPLAQRKPVQLQTEIQPGLPVVRIDAFRLIQVITNLVGNSIKFSPPDEKICVRARCIDSGVRVEVIDNGPGIDPEFRSRIFQKFAQANGGNQRDHGGTGLGLAISRELITRMDGVIGFDSEPGHGSCFWIELPASLNAPGVAAVSTH